MRSQGKTTLSELMGSKAGGKAEAGNLTLSDLPALLGERMPKLQFNAVGRVHLIRALNMRFGSSYRNLPGIEGILTEFDNEHKFENEIKRMKKLRPERKK